MRKSFNLIISIIPIFYFFIIQNTLDDIVPIHYNINGVADGYGSKYIYLILCFIPILLWILELIFQKYASKENLKYQSKSITAIILFFTILDLSILYYLQNENFKFLTILIILLGLLFMYLGNMFNKIEPNKHLGIRLPATLKNEKVWHRTHYIGGYIFFAIGLILILLTILQIPVEYSLLFLIISIFATLIFLYIYSEKLLKKELNKH